MAGIEDPSPGLTVAISAGPCEGTWTTYTQEHGLPNCVCDLGVAPDGTAWVLSEFGNIVTLTVTLVVLFTYRIDGRRRDSGGSVEQAEVSFSFWH